MQIPLELVFHGLPRSETIEDLVREQVDRLHRFTADIIGCRVAIEQPHRHRNSGKAWRVRVDVTVPPQKELVVSKELYDRDSGLPAIVRDAFHTMERKLKEINDQRRGDVKAHPHQQDLGIVRRLFRDEGYGFFETPEGEEVYFHRNSVLRDEFDRLTLGSSVKYALAVGAKGLQATSVQLFDHPASRRQEDTGVIIAEGRVEQAPMP